MKRIVPFFLLLFPSLALAQWELTPSESTAGQKKIFFSLVDDTDGKTPEPGLTISGSECQISLAGAAFADCTGTIAELSDGAYTYEPHADEMGTAGNHLIKIEEAAARLTFASYSTHELESGDFAPDGTAQAGAAGTLTLASGSSATDDLYNGRLVTIISGTGAGQSRLIADYVGATKVASIVPNWTTTPDNTSKYLLTAFGVIPGTGTGAIVAGSFDAGAVDSAALADSLTFTSLTISNSGGTALTIASSGSNGDGINISGNGSGDGIEIVPGATGNGIKSNGGATSGRAAYFLGGPGGNAFQIEGGTGSIAGLRLVGGTTGGAALQASSSSGDVITATAAAGGGSGLVLTGQGSGSGLKATGGATGVGVNAVGGATSGAGLSASSTTGDAVTVTSGGGNGDAIQLTPDGAGLGLNGTLGTITDASAAFLADFFTANSGQTSATAVEGSVVKEIGDLAVAGGVSADGTAQAVSATTITLASAETYANNSLNDHNSVEIISATAGVGQTRCVCSSSGDVMTLCNAWQTTPTGTVTYRVNPTPNCNPRKWPKSS